MNPRRVHDLMREHFPSFDAAKVEWTNIVEREGPNTQLLERILESHISAPDVLVEVHRKLGAMVPRHEAAGFISAHIGEGQIRVADRAFTSFIVVAQNGVVAGWKNHDG
jgi:hypothetical protein